MKKTIALVLVALTVLSGAFAWGMPKSNGPEMMLGVKTGWGMDMQFPENVDKTFKNSNVPVKADFTVMLDAPVAFSAALGTDVKIFPEEHTEDKTSAAFALDASVFYRYEASREFDLLAGLGFGWDYRSWSNDAKVEAAKVTTSLNSFSLFLDLRGYYEVADSIELFGGMQLGGDVAVSGKVKTSLGDAEYDKERGTNFSFGFNVGAAYRF